MNRDSQRGMSTVLALLSIVIGGGLVMFALALFATGLAQNRLLPMAKKRVAEATATWPIIGEEEPEEEIDPTTLVGSTGPDSLEALVTQLETHEAFLELQNEELVQLRSGLDSLATYFQAAQSEEVARQAKLFAGMGELEAAKIMHNLDDATLVAILKKMNSRAAAKVMAELDPRRLARLSMEGIGAEKFRQMADAAGREKTPKGKGGQ